MSMLPSIYNNEFSMKKEKSTIDALELASIGTITV
jgi:hypothetical protein